MKYLYRNEEGFLIERKLGMTDYYCKAVKATIINYALSDRPDFEEVERIVRTIVTYMKRSEFFDKIGPPIYYEEEFLNRIIEICKSILDIDRDPMSNMEEIKSLYKAKVDDINKAVHDDEMAQLSS